MWHGFELVILQVLSDSLGWSMSITELMQKTGLSRKKVTHSLKALAQQGKVRTQDGRFRVDS